MKTIPETSAPEAAVPVVGVPFAVAVDVSDDTPMPDAATAAEPVKPAKLDLCVTFDCTGSMGSYIHAAKTSIEAIATRLAAAEGYDLRFALVAYRDHPPQDNSYITKEFPFTDSVAEMKASLRTLSAQGGGDGPEAVERGLLKTLQQGWREDATKVCVLIADAPPHGLGESGDGFPNGAPDGVDPLAVLDEMSMKGICVYSVGCQPALSRYRFATDFFIAAAERTNGQAIALGSAAALADVILGGAIEEMDLEQLSAEMQTAVQSLSAANPALGEEELQQQVWRGMQAQGRQTRQIKTKKLSSINSKCVSGAACLAEARSALSHAPAPVAPKKKKSACPPSSLHFGGSLRSMDAEGFPELLDDLDELSSPLDELGDYECAKSGAAPAKSGGGFGFGLGGLFGSKASTPAPRNLARGRTHAVQQQRKDGMKKSAPAAPGAAMLSACPAASMCSAPEAEGCSLESEDISYEQVNRLYSKGKKKGMW